MMRRAISLALMFLVSKSPVVQDDSPESVDFELRITPPQVHQQLVYGAELVLRQRLDDGDVFGHALTQGRVTTLLPSVHDDSHDERGERRTVRMCAWSDIHLRHRLEAWVSGCREAAKGSESGLYSR